MPRKQFDPEINNPRFATYANIGDRHMSIDRQLFCIETGFFVEREPISQRANIIVLRNAFADDREVTKHLLDRAVQGDADARGVLDFIVQQDKLSLKRAWAIATDKMPRSAYTSYSRNLMYNNNRHLLINALRPSVHSATLALDSTTIKWKKFAKSQLLAKRRADKAIAAEHREYMRELRMIEKRATDKRRRKRVRDAQIIARRKAAGPTPIKFKHLKRENQ